MPKVSVIVPVYGVEKYIERCARSLFEQTLDDIEFIFINDCTPDKSIMVLEQVVSEYSSRKEQVRVIHMEKNSGQAAVRMKGIVEAKGDYLMFCDSDDWADKEMCSELYNEALNTKSSIVFCDYYVARDEGVLLHKRENFNDINSNKELIKDVLTQRISSSLWNKIIKRDIIPINLLYAPQGNMGEDLVLLIQYLYYSRKVSYIKKPLYYYYDNNSSITRGVSPSQIYSKFLQSELNTTIIESFLIREKVFDYLQNEVMLLKLRKINLLTPIISTEEYYQIWRNTYPELKKGVLFSRSIPLKDKIKFYITYFGINR